MTASDPERLPEPRTSGEQKMPDPWGVKRAENLLQSLEGVLSARVVVSPVGEVTEVHVLSQSGTHPKQVVRNVESALLAHLGLKVDHRKISVAQTADVKPIQALEQTAVRGAALERAIVFQREGRGAGGGAGHGGGAGQGVAAGYYRAGRVQAGAGVRHGVRVRGGERLHQ